MISKEVKSIIISSFGGELLSLLVIIVLGFLLPQPTWYQALILYMFVITIFTWSKLTFIKWLRTIAVLGVILFLFYNVAGRFVYGFITLILLLVAWRVVRDIRKDREGGSLFMTGVRDIEKRLFGKPLDKKEWRKK